MDRYGPFVFFLVPVELKIHKLFYNSINMEIQLALEHGRTLDTGQLIVTLILRE